MIQTDPEGWSITEYNKFKVLDDSDDTGSEASLDEKPEDIKPQKNPRRREYKKLLKEEELLPE